MGLLHLSPHNDHPQHDCKALKHFLYGMQSVGVCILNHDDTTLSFGLKPHTHPNFPKIQLSPGLPPPAQVLQCKGTRHTHMPIHSIIRCSNTFFTHCECGMQSEGVSDSTMTQQSHLGSAKNSTWPTSHCITVCKGTPICPPIADYSQG